MKSYFDGGNKADNREFDVATLACISGRTDQWKPFERAWKSLLNEAGAPWLHTTDTVSLKADPFTEENGWDEDRRDHFMGECVKVAAEHIALPIEGKFPGRDGLLAFTVTVVLDDFKRARCTNPEIPQNATEILATQALKACLDWGESRGAHFYYLYFDQNEPYRGHISDRCRNPKALRQLPLLDRVKHTGESDMRKAPALQIADLFAWCVSHKARPGYKWQKDLLRLARLDEWIEYNDLIKPIPGVADLVKTWKLPRRGPTK